MFIHPTYKAIKDRLRLNLQSPVCPIYFYIGQYLPGNENSSLTIPAIYIEFPKELNIDFFPKKRMVAKEVDIKVHYLSYAPFKNHDNTTQDLALEKHNARIIEIDKLLCGWNAVEEGTDRILTQQLITNGGKFMSFMEKAVATVLHYETEIFFSHSVIPT